ncbi:MAG: oxidase [Verrucomicrobiales bacterium]|nr:oxidase [Verrucomicrobiales bacterium]
MANIGESLNRRRFLRTAALAGLSASVLRRLAAAEDPRIITLPFENGERPLVKYPQKRPLIRQTTRPPQLETPFSVFNESVITPNDAFFVRYHLAPAPPVVDLEQFRLEVKGKVNQPLILSLSDLKRFEPVEVVAVNQCSGNSRGFFKPRVSGGQLGNGAMGNARWKGVRLKDVLERAGVAAGAKQVTFNGLDKGLLPTVPDFVKAIEVDQALDGELILAYNMNGEDLPVLNGYPLRLVMPGYFGTYWVKHLNEINVIDEPFNGFWMNPAYRIPDNTCACIEPGTTPRKTVPIARFNVRSFITSLDNGAKVRSGQTIVVKGITFDSGYGVNEVLFSQDDGRSWREAELGKDLGRFSFREWTIPFNPGKAGSHVLKVKATNRIGQSQPMEPLWNPAGYMRNVVETVNVNAEA